MRPRKAEVQFAEKLQRMIPELVVLTYTDTSHPTHDPFTMSVQGFQAYLDIDMKRKLLTVNYTRTGERSDLQRILKPLTLLDRKGWKLSALKWKRSEKSSKT